ncbi:MAG: hypothetical protein N2484_06265 [Clostridia bacterium]|nr:hypothetical protein [Clostridia bacterium]
MDCEANFYQCKNLLYWDSSVVHDYICTITGAKCNCVSSGSFCTSFEEEVEE